MPKVEYTPTKGLFQSSGSGIELSQGQSLVQKLNIKVLEETINMPAGAGPTTSTGTIPAGAVILGGTMKISTADTTNRNLTDLGTNSDTDRFGTGLSIATNATSTTALVPGKLIPETTAQTFRFVQSGATTGDGRIQICIYYMDVVNG